jgi:hypothetical protein
VSDLSGEPAGQREAEKTELASGAFMAAGSFECLTLDSVRVDHGFQLARTRFPIDRMHILRIREHVTNSGFKRGEDANFFQTRRGCERRGCERSRHWDSSTTWIVHLTRVSSL